MTAREDLHAFIDGLDDDSAEVALYVLRQTMSQWFPAPVKPVPLDEGMRPVKVPGSIFFAVSNANDLATIARMQDGYV
jgi:hypothetical protein